MLMTIQTETQNTKQESHTAQRFAGTIFGLVEIILAFRLIFKLLGANAANGFTQGLYAVTQFIVAIFEGIFARISVGGADGASIFEPATLIAMVVIALIAWAVLKLLTPRNGTRVVRTEQTENTDQVK
jgi:hypothetical protein